MGRIMLLLSAVVLVCSCAKKPAYPEAPFSQGGVRIELGALPENKPVFYTFYAHGKGINYFVVRLHDGVESYFDACVKCYPQERGYLFDGDRIACRACDVRYPLVNLKDGIGSCYPIKLPGRVDGGFYFIGENDLTSGVKYFR
jgi:uncharacterized membrane protein